MNAYDIFIIVMLNLNQISLISFILNLILNISIDIHIIIIIKYKLLFIRNTIYGQPIKDDIYIVGLDDTPT